MLSTKPDADPALLRDLSEIGLACTANQAIPEMTLVGLEFALPGGADRHQVKGAVVRCEPLSKAEQGKGSPKWDIAIYFTEMQTVTRAALKNYVGKGKPAR